MIGKTNALAGMKQKQEMVNISLSSNQASHDDLVGAVITLSYGEYSEEIVWDGSEVTRAVPAFVEYAVSFGEVEDHKAPAAVSYTAVDGNSRTVVGTYLTELVSVTLSADDGASMAGQTVTINGKEHTFDGNAVEQKVAYGVTYTVSASAKDGYATPEEQTFTAAQSARNLALTYVASALKVSILSNQTNDTTIAAVKAVVAYGDVSVEVASGETIEMPSGVEGTVTFPEVEGYKTPDVVAFNHESGLTEISGTYQTEMLTVNVSSDDGQVSGYEITISKQELVGVATKYTKLEYIEATGTQYIDTGFVPNQDTRVVVSCKYNATSSSSWLFGVRKSSGVAAFAYLSYNSKFRTDYNNSYSLYTDESTVETSHVDKNKNVTVVNGSETITDTYASFDSQYSLALCAINTAGSISGYSSAKIMSCQIYDNGTLIRDYIPAMREDGVAGLYDAVNDTFYPSSGSGNFVAGPEANYAEIEYIESTGTQYIDTGFKPNQDTRLVTTMIVPVTGDSNLAFGTRDSSSAGVFTFAAAAAGYYVSGYNNAQPKIDASFNSDLPIVIDKNKNVTYIDGVVAVSSTYASFESSYNLYLFAYNNSGSTLYGSTRMYGCKIFDNDVLVRDYVPMLRSDGVAGLYDKVNGKFYPSSGSENFVAGGSFPSIAVQTTATGTYKIPFDTSYVITSSNVASYEAPEALFFTAEGATRIVPLQYIYKPAEITVIRINQTITDPNSMITRIVDGGGIEAIRANSHRYVGDFATGSMVLRQLDDSDSSKFLDGSDATDDHWDIGSSIYSDVWMKLPQFYWKCVEYSTDVWDFYVAYGNRPDETYKEWDGKDLIGVYKAHYDSSSGLRSWKDKTLFTTYSWIEARDAARERGDGFTLVKWKHHCMMAMLFYTYYGKTNSQAVVGAGVLGDADDNPGTTYALGMNDTVAGSNGDEQFTNFWGLESWWGHVFEYIDNVRYDYSSDTGTFTITEDDGSTRTINKATSLKGYVKKMLFGENIDLIITASGASTTTGFCDNYGHSSNGGVCSVARSCNSNSSNGGVAYLDTHQGYDNADGQICTRLAYRGDYTIVS